MVRHLTGPRCPGCSLRPSLCMCASLPRVKTKTRVVVVMHALERHKSTNTGRLAHACLPNSDVVVVGRDRSALPARPWPADHVPIVLFPVAGAEPVARYRDVDKLALVVLDGNWRQAAKLRRRFAVQNIPFVAAPAATTTYRLRSGPHEEGMSTFEAIARSLGALEDDVDVAALLHALAMFQDRTLWARGAIGDDDVTGGLPITAVRHSRT